MSRACRLSVCLGPVIVVFFASGTLPARPDYLEAWRWRYLSSTLPERMERETGTACAICHTGPGPYRHDDPGNCYRESIHLLRHEGVGGFAEALVAAEELDADADGIPSGEEILLPRRDGEVGYHPGLAGEPGLDRCGGRADTLVSRELETPPRAPGLRFEPPLIGFGRPAPAAFVDRWVRVRNAGDRERTVLGVGIPHGATTNFAIEARGDLPRLLAPGESLELRITYREARPGYFYQFLAWPEIKTDDRGSPRAGAVLRSLDGVPVIDAPSSLELGVAEVGAEAAGSFTIANRGDWPLRVEPPRPAVGADLAVRVASPTAPVTIPPGEALPVEIVAVSAREGPLEATISMPCDDPFRPAPGARVRLEGRWRVTAGDANRDGEVDLSDAVSILSALFLGGPSSCLEAEDADASGAVDISDPIRILGALFLGRPPLSSPCMLESEGTYLGCREGPGECREAPLP